MRKGKILLSSLLCFAIILSLTIPIPSHAEASLATIYVPDDYLTIQAAVNVATPGDTIIVRDGTYIENVDVTKSVTIQFRNGADVTIVQAIWNYHVFRVTANDSSILGFTIQGLGIESEPGLAPGTGIGLFNADHSTIADNHILNNGDGIYSWYSDDMTLVNNVIESNMDRGSETWYRMLVHLVTTS